MRLLSVYQPWASLLAIGAKQYETRGREVSYRGLVAIHAAKKWNAGLAALADSQPFRQALVEGDLDPANLPRGQILAVARLGACYPTERVVVTHNLLEEDSLELEFGDFSAYRFAWRLDDPVQVSGLPYKGMQGLVNLPEDLAGRLTTIWRAARKAA